MSNSQAEESGFHLLFSYSSSSTLYTTESVGDSVVVQTGVASRLATLLQWERPGGPVVVLCPHWQYMPMK